MSETKIEWADYTFNPWHGCTEVSPACDHCYARVFSQRIGYSDTGSKFPIWGKDAARRFFGDKHWAEPLKWNTALSKANAVRARWNEPPARKRVFCGSMCDVMEDYNGAEHLVRETMAESREWLWRLIEKTPNLDWLLLTKRPQNFRRFLPPEWLERPRANVTGMTTVESGDYIWRINELLKTPFATRGLSMEPLLGPVDIEDYLYNTCRLFDPAIAVCDGPDCPGRRIDWVIVGSESGHGARETNIEWVRSLKGQCVQARVAFFYKQDAVKGRAIPTPVLDGRTWVQFPALDGGAK